MFELRKAADRGQADHGWLRSAHSFSFANYFDPRHMGFSSLRVINEDRVDPGQGFGTHGHRDMEIISYVIDGQLAHKDSMGNGSTIGPGDVQRMTAGTGVQHSEFNPQRGAPVHFLQIWIEPREAGLTPGYEERHFSAATKRGSLQLIASGHGEPEAVVVHQDMRLYAGLFDGAESVTQVLAAGRAGYLHVVQGSAQVNEVALQAGDAVKLAGEDGQDLTVTISGGQQAEVLFFDLAGPATPAAH